MSKRVNNAKGKPSRNKCRAAVKRKAWIRKQYKKYLRRTT